MNSIITQLKTVATDLTDLKIPWALIGALAVSVHTEPRTTRDIDIAITIAQHNALEEIEAKLLALGYGRGQFLMHAVPTQKMGLRMAIPTTVPPSVPLDLLFAFSGIEPEIIKEAVTIELLPEVFIPVASIHHILAMKIVSQNDGDRIRDRVDVQKLLAVATEEDILKTKEALRLIETRGFHRGKDLFGDLEADIHRYRQP